MPHLNRKGGLKPTHTLRRFGGSMARRNGKCVTVGYVSTLTGEPVMFGKPKTELEGRKATQSFRAHDAVVLARVGTPDWCELDDWLYPELSKGA